MSKNYILALLLLAFSTTVNAQSKWVNVKIDDKLTAMFPSEPEKQIANGSISYKLTTKDSLILTASVLDYQVIAKLDAVALNSTRDTKDFSTQLRNGIASQRKNFEFGDVTLAHWKTYSTYTISGTKSADKSKLFLKMILIGSKMYALSCLIPNNLTNKEGESFLNSFELI